jgi:hypothetical protein
MLAPGVYCLDAAADTTKSKVRQPTGQENNGEQNFMQVNTNCLGYLRISRTMMVSTVFYHTLDKVM